MTRFHLLAGAAALALPAVPTMAQEAMPGMEHHHHDGPAAPTPSPAPAPTPPMDDHDMAAMDQPDSAPLPSAEPASEHSHHNDHTNANHHMAAMAGMGGMSMPPNGEPLASGDGSGTSRVPGYDGGHHGLHVPLGNDWTLMVHGYVTAQYTHVSGPRGGDGSYSLSHIMFIGERDTGWGRIQLRSAFSFDRLSVGRGGYPSLFTVGEVAFGAPLVDHQHPHDLFTELSARVDINVADDASLFLYGGPAAEPALGPAAYLHRASAKYNPDPPITHHWFDSTHLAFGVATAGYAARHFQIEASAFRGREPDERRFDIEPARLDSWSIRATWNPSPYWSLQASTGRLRSVEELRPDEDEQRTIASVQYANGAVSAFLGFSVKDPLPRRTLTAWLGEVNWDVDRHHSLFGRIENVASDELIIDDTSPLHDRPFRVTKYQAGYAYRVPVGPVSLALGGTVATFAKPDALDAIYGTNPFAYTLFARISIGH